MKALGDHYSPAGLGNTGHAFGGGAPVRRVLHFYAFTVETRRILPQSPFSTPTLKLFIYYRLGVLCLH